MEPKQKKTASTAPGTLILDVVGLMIGATETAQGGNGLVPAPGIG